MEPHGSRRRRRCVLKRRRPRPAQENSRRPNRPRRQKMITRSSARESITMRIPGMPGMVSPKMAGRLLHHPQPLPGQGEEGRGQNRPGGGTQAPHHDDDQQVEGEEEGEERRRDGGDEVGQQPASHPEAEGAQEVGPQQVAKGIDPHGLGRGLVFPDGLHGPAVAGVDQGAPPPPPWPPPPPRTTRDWCRDSEPLRPRGPLVSPWRLLARTRTTSPKPRVTMAR